MGPDGERPREQRKVFVNRRAVVVIGCLLALAVGAAMVACQPVPTIVPPSEPKAGPKAGGIAIYVTSNGWHTGIAVARASLPAGVIPETADFPEAPYLEFGWGDAEYYPAPRPTLGMALGAAIGPNPAIVHLIGLPAHPRQVFPKSEVVDLGLSPEGFQKLVRYLDATFARDGAERARPSAPGLHSFSLFYPATGKFSLFNTCNTWAARGLAAAGVPIDPSGVVRAEELMVQIRKISAGS